MVKPFSVGQRIGCRVSIFALPHQLRRALVVQSVRLERTKYIPPYYRVRAHVEGQPDLWIEASADRFWVA